MTPALVLLARCCLHSAEAIYIVPRLALDRRPHSRVDRQELVMWRDVAPILAQHGGYPARIRAACPARWLGYLDTALALPDWFVERAEPTPDLLTRWVTRGSLGWALPAAEPAAVRFDPFLLREAA